MLNAPALGSYGGAEQKMSAPRDVQPPSFTERLRDEKNRLEIRLQQINELLAALESNPETMRIVDMIQRVSHL